MNLALTVYCILWLVEIKLMEIIIPFFLLLFWWLMIHGFQDSCIFPRFLHHANWSLNILLFWKARIFIFPRTLFLFSDIFTATEQADTAYGVFCLFNMIIYLVYAIILSVHRRSVVAPVQNLNSSTYKGDNNGEVVNPNMGNDNGDYGGDEVEL